MERGFGEVAEDAAAAWMGGWTVEAPGEGLTELPGESLERGADGAHPWIALGVPPLQDFLGHAVIVAAISEGGTEVGVEFEVEQAEVVGADIGEGVVKWG